jgi:hypothetical protein
VAAKGCKPQNRATKRRAGKKIHVYGPAGPRVLQASRSNQPLNKRTSMNRRVTGSRCCPSDCVRAVDCDRAGRSAGPERQAPTPLTTPAASPRPAGAISTTQISAMTRLAARRDFVPDTPQWSRRREKHPRTGPASESARRHRGKAVGILREGQREALSRHWCAS